MLMDYKKRVHAPALLLVASILVFVLQSVLDALSAIVDKIFVHIVTALGVKCVDYMVRLLVKFELESAVLFVLGLCKIFQKLLKLFGFSLLKKGRIILLFLLVLHGSLKTVSESLKFSTLVQLMVSASLVKRIMLDLKLHCAGVDNLLSLETRNIFDIPRYHDGTDSFETLLLVGV